MLVQTVPYYIKQDQIQNAPIRLQPEKTMYKDKLVTRRFLGIAVSWADSQTTFLIWKQTQVRNDEQLTPVRLLLPGETVKSTTIVSNIDFEFTERIYTVNYYTFLDMLSSVGGLRASLEPFFHLFIPLFTAYFFYTFAGIVQRKIAENREQKTLELIETARK